MLFLQCIDLVNDFIWVHIMHHRAKGYGLHVDSGAGETAVPEIFLDYSFCTGAHFYDIPDY